MFPKLLLVRVYYQSNRLDTVRVMREGDPQSLSRLADKAAGAAGSLQEQGEQP